MSFQGTLAALLGIFITFYLACAAIGRPDIPLRVIAELRAEALDGAKASWGCPSAFQKNACRSYVPGRYR